MERKKRFSTYPSWQRMDETLTHTSLSSNLKSIQTRLHRDVKQESGLSRYAFVTLATDTKNITQCILIACFLKEFSTRNIDRVVMVTPNITAKFRAKMKKYFHVVTEVRALHDHKNDNMFTKLNCLGLMSYDKVLYISHRMLVLQSIEEIFRLEPPAGIVTIYQDKHQNNWHGIKAGSEIIDNSLKLAKGVKTCLLLLKPNLKDFIGIQNASSVGQSDCFLSADVAYITRIYKNDWTHIHNKYGFPAWLPPTVYQPVCYLFENDEEFSHRKIEQLKLLLEKQESHDMIQTLNKVSNILISITDSTNR